MNTATIDAPKVVECFSRDGNSTTTTYTDGSFVTAYDDGVVVKGQRHEDDDLPPAVAEADAERIARLREQILDDLRAQAVQDYERMMAAASLEDGHNVARGFLANVCGQFDYLGKVERGEA